MAPAKFSVGLCLALLFAGAIPALAQLSPSEPDPLARIRDAAKSNVQACSATGETLCEQVAPKLVANAEGDSLLEANLRRLAEADRNDMRISNEDPAVVTWALASFRDAKVDVHTERYPAPASPSRFGRKEIETVVGEIPGREQPGEWVVMAAELGELPSHDQACNAASLIEAARAIQLTRIRPRRSIRFVVFAPEMDAKFHYLQSHRGELDRVSAVIIMNAAANPVDGFVLNGRHDVEPGVREAMQPISSAMGVTHHTFDAPLDRFSIGFLLEGIPTLLTRLPEPVHHASSNELAALNSPDRIEVRQLKRNIAVAAVAAFGIAERAEPIGPRQSRAEIESLLKRTGLEQQMKYQRLWPLWESVQRGRMRGQ